MLSDAGRAAGRSLRAAVDAERSADGSAPSAAVVLCGRAVAGARGPRAPGPRGPPQGRGRIRGERVGEARILLPRGVRCLRRAAGLLTRGSLPRRLPGLTASGFSTRERLPLQRRDRPGLAPGSLSARRYRARAYHRPVAAAA